MNASQFLKQFHKESQKWCIAGSSWHIQGVFLFYNVKDELLHLNFVFIATLVMVTVTM